VKTVGKRATVGGGIAEQGAYVRAAAALRGTEALVPRGVYRFHTFDEAESWLNTTIRRTHARLSQPISPASAGRWPTPGRGMS
jgi:hypothetical protein